MGWHKKDKQKFTRPSIILVSSFLLIGFMVFSGVSFIARAQDNKETEATPFHKCVIDSLNSEEINRKSNRKYSHKVTDAELGKLKKFECKDIYSQLENSLLQKMINLKEISFMGNISVLDFSSNPKLEKIKLFKISSDIRKMDFSKNTELRSLEFSENSFLDITDLDLTNNIKLEKLILSVKNLAGLDVSKNTELKILKVDDASDRLKDINLTNNLKLEKVSLDFNISSLDLSKNINLKELFIRASQISSLNLLANKKLASLDLDDPLFESLDLSQNKELTSFTQSGGKLTIDFFQIPNLKKVNLYGEYYKYKFFGSGCLGGHNDVTNSNDYETLKINPPVLAGYRQLDFSNNSKLQEVHLINMQLDKLDVSKNIMLDTVGLSNYSLPSLDVSHNKYLLQLIVTCGNLNKIDLSNNLLLKEISFRHGVLESVKFRQDKTYLDIRRIDLSYNKLKELALPSGYFGDLNLSYNQLSTLDLSHRGELKNLDLSNNQLSTLDLSETWGLERLNLASNRLSNLDLSKNSYLKELGLSYNQFTKLSFFNNHKLELLSLLGESLTDLDLSKNINLRFNELELSAEKPIKVKVPTKTAKDILANKYSNLIIEVAEGENDNAPKKVEIIEDDEAEFVDDSGLALALLALTIFRVIPSIIALVIIFLKKRKLKKARKLIN